VLEIQKTAEDEEGLHSNDTNEKNNAPTESQGGNISLESLGKPSPNSWGKNLRRWTGRLLPAKKKTIRKRKSPFRYSAFKEYLLNVRRHRESLGKKEEHLKERSRKIS